MMTVEMTRDALDAAGRALSGKGPVHMVNLVRYRAQADYGGQAGFPPCSGREAYLGRYVAAFAQVAGKVAPGETFRPVFLGSVAATVVAPPGEAWDDIAILEYPSFDALRKIIEAPEYEAEAAPIAGRRWRTGASWLPSRPNCRGHRALMNLAGFGHGRACLG